MIKGIPLCKHKFINFKVVISNIAFYNLLYMGYSSLLNLNGQHFHKNSKLKAHHDYFPTLLKIVIGNNQNCTSKAY